MMTRIGRGEDYILTNADAWRIRTLQESGELLKDILAARSAVSRQPFQAAVVTVPDAESV